MKRGRKWIRKKNHCNVPTKGVQDKEMFTARLAVRLDPRMKKAFQDQAKACGMKESEVLRCMILDWLEKWPEKNKE